MKQTFVSLMTGIQLYELLAQGYRLEAIDKSV